MSTMVTLAPGGSLTLDPSDQQVIQFDWDTENLADGATIATSTYAVEVVKQTGATALTFDNASILAGNRITQVRLIASTARVGDRYRVFNRIVTNETPAQTKERSIQILVQNR